MRPVEDMTILLVDDSRVGKNVIRNFLSKAGFTSLVTVDSAAEAFERLGMGRDEGDPGVDLILLDIVMKDMDGIDALRRIKSDERLGGIPVIMVTGQEKNENLEEAFNAGAIDYLIKPVNKIELTARVRSILRLKLEIDERKDREAQLEAVNRKLRRLSSLDGLTGIANRRYFDKEIETEWRRTMRDGKPLTVAMADIDYFKRYNDHYGHQAGDAVLKQVAQAMRCVLKRPGDLVARYGGEEFVIVLPGTDAQRGLLMAEKLREEIASLKIKHERSDAAGHVTISVGVATIVPNAHSSPAGLVEAADKALYRAKHEGRDRVVSLGR